MKFQIIRHLTMLLATFIYILAFSVLGAEEKDGNVQKTNTPLSIESSGGNINYFILCSTDTFNYKDGGYAILAKEFSKFPKSQAEYGLYLKNRVRLKGPITFLCLGTFWAGYGFVALAQSSSDATDVSKNMASMLLPLGGISFTVGAITLPLKIGQQSKSKKHLANAVKLYNSNINCD